MKQKSCKSLGICHRRVDRHDRIAVQNLVGIQMQLPGVSIAQSLNRPIALIRVVSERPLMNLAAEAAQNLDGGIGGHRVDTNDGLADTASCIEAALNHACRIEG